MGERIFLIGRTRPSRRASAMKKVPSFVRAEIVHASYEEHAPGAGWIVYCDPPYAGTLGYAGGASFDSAEFWKVARSWADAGALVVVSEQEAPEDWEAIAGRTRKANFRLAVGEENEVRQERLFMRPEQIPRWLR
jgi:site-specific DNA-adenine methylase